MGEALKKINTNELQFLSVNVSEIEISVELSDGRKVSVPLAWFPKLLSANLDQLKKFEISPSGYGIHWPDLDEDISVRAFVG